MSLSIAGYYIYLTDMEFDVLDELIINSPNAVSKTRLASSLYVGRAQPVSKTIETVIWRLRKKLAFSCNGAASIATDHFGAGYKLIVSEGSNLDGPLDQSDHLPRS
ncbi:winged helix-turn-helix domain-containing protein [Sphingomonas sp. RT2P30]|uniref:winged helix-turn-helix domain-containing protein n=1 Tax=Parasphingomonas halimpatiens TaxID=3096162 RepID=UPI002FC84834